MKGWSRTNLGKRCGFKSRSTVSKIERNKTRPTPETLERMAKALGADLSLVLTTRREKTARRFHVVRGRERRERPHWEKGKKITWEWVYGEPRSRVQVILSRLAKGYQQAHREKDFVDEQYLVVKGKVRVSYPGKWASLEKGDCVGLNPVVRHGLHNIGRTEAHVLVFKVLRT